MESQKRLVRSTTDRMLGGVCGGLAQYLGLDSVWVRLFFVLLLFGQGIGFWVYIVLWVILPREGSGQFATSETVHDNVQEIGERARNIGSEFREGFHGTRNEQGLIVIGGALIFLGVIYLIQNLNLPWLYWLRFDILWPILLVVAGIALIVRRTRQ